MDSVKGLCERLERRADQAPTRFHWQSAELREAATALTSLSRELAEVRRINSERAAFMDRQAEAIILYMARALAAEAASASKDERIRELGQVTERALPYLIHFVRQRWDGDFTYSVEEAIRRWSEGEFHNDAAESDAKARARSTKEPT